MGIVRVVRVKADGMPKMEWVRPRDLALSVLKLISLNSGLITSSHYREVFEIPQMPGC